MRGPGSELKSSSIGVRSPKAAEALAPSGVVVEIPTPPPPPESHSSLSPPMKLVSRYESLGGPPTPAVERVLLFTESCGVRPLLERHEALRSFPGEEHRVL